MKWNLNLWTSYGINEWCKGPHDGYTSCLKHTFDNYLKLSINAYLAFKKP